VAYVLAGRFEVTWLLPFAAGNFLYIAAADLIPELTGYPEAARKALLSAMFVVGLAVLVVVAVVLWRSSRRRRSAPQVGTRSVTDGAVDRDDRTAPERTGLSMVRASGPGHATSTDVHRE
jgi:hypothetical protein